MPGPEIGLLGGVKAVEVPEDSPWRFPLPLGGSWLVPTVQELVGVRATFGGVLELVEDRQRLKLTSTNRLIDEALVR